MGYNSGEVNDVSEKHIASIFRVGRASQAGPVKLNPYPKACGTQGDR
jgi:hypothetical protein